MIFMGKTEKEIKFCKKFYMDGTKEYFDKEDNPLDMTNMSIIRWSLLMDIVEKQYTKDYDDIDAPMKKSSLKNDDSSMFYDFNKVQRVDSNPNGEVTKYDKDNNLLYHKYPDGFIEEFEYGDNNNVESYSNSNGVEWINLFNNEKTNAYNVSFDRESKILSIKWVDRLSEKYYYNNKGRLIYYKNNLINNNINDTLYNDKVDKELYNAVKKSNTETREIYENICESNIDINTINISSICEQIFTNILYSLIDKEKYDENIIEFYAIRFGGFKLSE